jgi:uncharacterized protein CbrC (UPF0167 family)
LRLPAAAFQALGVSDLPKFRYHPDPLGTGSVMISDDTCRCCGRQRGYVYTGPTYCEDEVDGEICPWCIADGSASALLGAEFTDSLGAPSDVPREIVTQLLTRTPGFSGWQQEHWLYHCADAAMFLGRIGYQELREVPDALQMVRQETEEFNWSAEENDQYVRSLHPEGDVTGYLFRCHHCGAYLAYTDMS